ncbi:uncharacterized protein LOC111495995 [Cucurbita maxima]|uniref:Uncharacterized protein LOC111495995 n=1 Tax=Cucurbita maxima TaxID=3661 RepID=A0A6J1KS53_CUCMA|nr:uncharacterized protein LOC111495995 [Cucurbita maxima]
MLQSVQQQTAKHIPRGLLSLLYLPHEWAPLPISHYIKLDANPIPSPPPPPPPPPQNIPTKMVGVFRRSLSFPNKPPAISRQTKPRISRHLRSLSLPCRSHPLISSLKEEIANLKSWSSTDHRDADWLCRGLTTVKLVHDYLDDILQLPQSRESICRLSKWVENVLEDFLRFIDAYGIFQSLILGFREEHVAAHVAIRRKDKTKLDLYTKARKRMAKETTQLVSVVRGVKAAEGMAVSEEELEAAIKDVMEVTGMVSVAVFEGIGASLGSRRNRWTGKTKKVENGILEFMEVSKNGEVDELTVRIEKMRDLEEGIRCIESSTEKLFRRLIDTRVSILNAISH